MATAKKKAPAKSKQKGRAVRKRERKPQEAKHEPTDQTRAIVERLSLIQKLTHDEIGAVIGVSDVTLRKYYGDILRVAKGKTAASVLNSYLENCIGTRGRDAIIDDKGNVIRAAIAPRPGDVKAQTFYIDRFLGMGAKTEVDVNATVTVESPDLSDATDDELEALEALAARMAGGASRSH